MSRYFLLAISCLLILIASTTRVQAQLYNFRNYTVENGLVQSQVYSICQDHRGYLWIGTGAGLSAFNGVSFRNYTVAEGLKDNLVNSLCVDGEGKVWIGTERGLSFSRGSEIINNEFTNGFHNVAINVIYEDAQDRIWLGTRDQGVYCYNGEQLVHINRELGLSSNTCLSINSDREGRILLGTVNGLNWLDDQGIENLFSGAPGTWEINALTVEDGLSSNRILSIYEDDGNNIWLGTYEGGVNIFKLNSRSNRMSNMIHLHKDKQCGVDSVKCYTGLIDESAESLTEDWKGRVWIGSYVGLSLCQKTADNTEFQFTIIKAKNGLGNDLIYSALIDREGNPWFGTNNGVSMFQGMKFIHINSVDDLGGSMASSVYVDRDNTIWAGTWGSGVYKFNSLNIDEENVGEHFNAESGIADVVFTVSQFETEGLWIGSGRDGLYRLTDKETIHYDMSNGSAFRAITVIHKDSNGKLWLGAMDGGICITDEENPRENKLLCITKRDGLAGNNIASIVEDGNGYMWVATDGGLSRVRNDLELISQGEIPEILTFNESNGLISRMVRSLRIDATSNLWMGTDNGIARLDLNNSEEINFTHITIDEGLTSNTVYVIDFDASGDLWIGSNKGLDRLDMALYNSTGEVSITHHSTLEGFTGIECFRNGSFLDHEGNLWFATKDGVTKYTMEEDSINKVEPGSMITGIRLFFEEVDWKEHTEAFNDSTGLPLQLELPYSQNHLTFDFVGVSLTIPEKVKYKFFLKGLDNDWSPPTDKQEAVYSSLPSGNYTFMVMSANNDGVWNTEPVTFQFRINPPFWARWWFILIGIAGIIGGFLAYLNNREQGILEQQRVLERMVEDRTSQLKEKTKEVEAQNKEIAKKSKDITGSIQYAKRIQEAVLPDRDSLQDIIPASFIFFKPRDIVSGDFYWFKEEGGKVFIAAVDCTGHGVPGAFMCMVANQLLGRIIINNGVRDPGEVLQLLHSGIVGALYKKDQESNALHGLDMVLCSFDLKEKRVDYACGTRPLLRIRDKKGELFKGDKYPIGLVLGEERNYTTHSLDIEPGDRFYIYSDGFSDQFGGPNYNKFMSQNFIDLLAGLHDVKLSDQEESLEKTMKEWIGDRKQVDDMLIIGVGL